jgi:hypothetical protein
MAGVAIPYQSKRQATVVSLACRARLRRFIGDPLLECPGIRPHREDRSAWQVEISVSVASRLLAGRYRVGEGRVLSFTFIGDKTRREGVVLLLSVIADNVHSIL